MGGYASTLMRFGSSAGRPRYFWIEARHGGKGAGRSRSIRRRISANEFGDGDLRHLESDVTAVVHDLGADLDELLP